MNTTKTVIAATVFAILPTLSFAMGCNYGHTTPTTATLSCSEGTSFNVDTGKCEPTQTS